MFGIDFCDVKLNPVIISNFIHGLYFKNCQSHSVEYNFNWCWHLTLLLKKRRFPIFQNLLKTSGTTKVLTAAWRYCWLACVLIALQVVRMLSPDSRLSQFFPSLPIPKTPGLVPKSPWRNSSTASAEDFYYSFYYNEGLEHKLTRALLLRLAKSIY